jgi:4-aminobutyrate--pyruvate transaminase
VGHVRSVSPALLDGLGSYRTHPLVGDVRGVGLLAGVELVQDKAAKTPFPPAARVGAAVEAACLAEGLIVRAIGDRIAFTPPLVITREEVAELCRRFGAGLDRALARLDVTAAA